MRKTILAIGAHPDDIEFGCGGTLARLQQQGYRTIHVLVTSGEEGSLTLSKKKLLLIRENEARQSAEILGASEVIFMREPDGLTQFSKELKIKLITLLRHYTPELVFTHGRQDHFHDHRVVHQLTVSALSACGGPWYPDAGGAPHTVSKVYGYEVWNPLSEYQMSSDISSTIDKKLQALASHTSQTGDVDYRKAAEGLGRYRGIMSLTSSSAGTSSSAVSTPTRYAEVFEVIKSGDLL